MRDTKRQLRSSRESRMSVRFVRLAAPVLSALLFIVAGVACNDAGASDPTPVQTFKITPASGTYIAVSAVTPTPASIKSPPASANAITLAGQDLKFDQTALTAAPGAVTIRFSNKDSGVPHNLHVFDGTDAKGKSLGQTDLATGPVDQELKLDLAAGAYYFQCDAHPTTMKGTLTVKD